MDQGQDVVADPCGATNLFGAGDLTADRYDRFEDEALALEQGNDNDEPTYECCPCYSDAEHCNSCNACIGECVILICHCLGNICCALCWGMMAS